jgi:hypothetical protein
MCVCVCARARARVHTLVALGIQHSMRMRQIVICGLLVSNILFHIFLQKHDFRKNVTGYKMYVWLSLQRLPETFLIQRIVQLDMIENV